MWGLATPNSRTKDCRLVTKYLWQINFLVCQTVEEDVPGLVTGGAGCDSCAGFEDSLDLRSSRRSRRCSWYPELIDEKFGRFEFVHGIARGLVTGGAGRLRVARDLSHPSVTRDAWSQRNRRCSWYHGAYRREIRSLPVRPWDRARTRYRRSRPPAGSARFIPSLGHPRPFAGSARWTSMDNLITLCAWSRRSRRCSWYHGVYRREIRSLPVRPWDKAVSAVPRSSAGFPSRSAIPRGACRNG